MKIQLSGKQNLFFCSDPHYGHSGIVKGTSKWEDASVCRSFESLEEHDNTLVNNINNTVGEDDILFCLGDWSFGAYKTGENISNIKKFRDALNCKNIHLIFGNHDKEIQDCKDLFSSTEYYREILVIEESFEQGVKATKQKIVLSHYSHRVWNNMRNNAWMLFGHSHGNLKSIEGKTMDVGFDTHPDFRPYNYQEIKEIMKNKNIVKLDHHIFESRDYRGTFQFRIHKDLDQIQVQVDMDDEFEGDDIHFDVDRKELAAIRDLITKVLGE